MNIIEAYLKFNNQLVILISAFPECLPNAIIKSLAKALKLKLIKQSKYLKDNDNKYSNESFDWDKFNEDVTNNKKSGVLIAGYVLPTDIITFKIDYHIHLALNKQSILKKIKIDKDEEGTKQLVNKTIYPYYLESIKRATINTFINMYTSNPLDSSIKQAYKSNPLDSSIKQAYKSNPDQAIEFVDDSILEDEIWEAIMLFIQKSVKLIRT